MNNTTRYSSTDAFRPKRARDSHWTWPLSVITALVWPSTGLCLISLQVAHRYPTTHHLTLTRRHAWPPKMVSAPLPFARLRADLARCRCLQIKRKRAGDQRDMQIDISLTTSWRFVFNAHTTFDCCRQSCVQVHLLSYVIEPSCRSRGLLFRTATWAIGQHGDKSSTSPAGWRQDSMV